jgi:hypothetical protein
MTKARQLLELFDKHYEYTHKRHSDTDHEYKFKSDNGEDYSVNISHNKYSPNIANAEFVDSDERLTNNNRHSKDAHKILGTVKHIMDDHAYVHNVSKYVIHADLQRATVYNAMAKGHKVEEVPSLIPRSKKFVIHINN